MHGAPTHFLRADLQDNTRSVMAHEVGHALLRTKGIEIGGHPERTIDDRIKTIYHPEMHREEQAVADFLQEWGFDEELPSLWLAALGECGLDWRPEYKRLLAERKNRAD